MLQAERSIPFSVPMVPPILAGTKTMTRRAISPQPYADEMGNACWNGWNFGQSIERVPLFKSLASPIPSSRTKRVHCPYGAPGGMLWVREPWRTIADLDGMSGSEIAERCLGAGYSAPWAPIQYEADGRRVNWQHVGTPPHDGAPVPGRYRHGRFMPRWASRIRLKIAGVRVERLQDITEADAIAEGIVQLHDGGYGLPGGEHYHAADPRQSFLSLFEAINGPGSVQANPWVWVVQFKRVEVSK